MLPKFGITRVAVLTGLDIVGIPVAAAYRPNSRSIAVHQGKGRTLADAKTSAIMEAIECWHAEIADLFLRWGNVEEIARHGRTVDVEQLPLTEKGSPRTARFLWTEGRDLISGTSVWVPYEIVSVDLTVPVPASFGIFRQTTNGLACGNTPVEAMLQGLYEAVERDAVAAWHASSPEQKGMCCVDPATVDGANSRWALQRFADAFVTVRIWDVTTDIGLPAFIALTCDEDGIAGVEPELGAGCHANADVALARALAEAAQARVTRISGARDDFSPSSFAVSARFARGCAAARLLQMIPRRGFRSTSPATTPDADLEAALAKLSASGRHTVVCVDLTRPDIGIPVNRIIVPGLRGPVL
jgi:ribosomal protein S12 methylthiotransferase accessory factor